MAPKRNREDPDSKEQKSLLSSAAEIAFPRGGGSVLTPLEMKEVSNEVKRDVLFQKSKNQTDEPKLKKPKKSNKKFNILSKDEESTNSDNQISIDTLSYNILNPGSYVLGIVKQINKMELVLALPDNLVGFIPITNISSQLITLLEKYDDQNESSDDDSDDENDKSIAKSTSIEFPDLSQRFTIGQYLRAKVIANQNEKQKKRFELSIEPEQVNSSMDQNDDFIENSIVQASISSIEDHGAILNFGKNIKVSGFISKKELANGNFNNIDVGSVILVNISKVNSRTATCKSPSLTLKKQQALSSVSSIDAILPGLFIDATIEKIESDGLICKAFDLCDASLTLQDMGSLYSPEEIKHKFAVGSILKARVIATYMKNGSTKISISVLPSHQTLSYVGKNALEAFPIGYIFDSVTIKGKSDAFMFVDLHSGEIPGQIHNSRISKEKDLDLDFKIGSNHKARILDYSVFDNLYILTFDQSKIDANFIRANDIPVGKVVNCKIEKVSSDGIVVQIEDSFIANVPAFQISDIKLVYPERKFKIGSKVKGRILNVRSNGSKSIITVTLKRSLVNANEDEIVSDYSDLKVDKRVPATVQKILPSGCVVSFFGNLSAFLPNAEISEAFVQNPSEYVKLGQTVKVRIVSFNKENNKCLVSLRISGDMSEDQIIAIDSLIPGKSIVNAEIIEKERDAIIVKLDNIDLRGIIHVGHLADGPTDLARSQLKKLKVGDKIETLVVLIDNRKRGVTLSAKPSLIKDAKAGVFPTKYSDISVSDKVLHGFVKTVIPTGVFVSFGDKLTGLVVPRFATPKRVHDLTTVFTPDQSVSCNVINVDENNQRFLLSLLVETANSKETAEEPVDKSIKTLGDFTIGRITKCIIKSIENTHLLVKLSDNQFGRIDINEIYDNMKSIKDLKNPLKDFKVGQKLEKAKIIGFYDSVKDKFLHSKKSKNNLVELTIKPKNLKSEEIVYPVSFNDIKEGDEYVGYINSIGNGYFWYSISPAQKAKLSFVDVTDNIKQLENFNEEFKVGTVIPTKVTHIDVDHYAINVSGRSHTLKSSDDIKVGDVLPSLILNVRANSLLVSLGDNITAVSMATDALDDYSLQLKNVFKVGEFHTATVLSVENKVYVSLRGKNPKDRLISSVADIKRGDIVRGYVNKITNSGLLVDLGRTVYALVRISDISDAYLKDWKSKFNVNDSVEGRIIEASGEGRVLLSLKDSVVKGSLKNLKSFFDLKIGEVYEGTIKRVAEYGVFVSLDGTENVSGLCHRSEITDGSVVNAEDIFNEGERVKVKILDINESKKQLSLGMKASYFNEESDIEMEDNEKVEDDENEDELKIQDFENNEIEDAESDNEKMEVDELHGSDNEKNSIQLDDGFGLSTGFDWTASILEQAKDEESSDEEEEFNNEVNKKSKKSKKAVTIEDKTGDFNTKTPQSTSDFERLLIGNPDSSILWIQYMSFQLQLSEIEKAREIAERALKTINFREEQQKMNIWIALLNLENSFGDEETLDSIFKRSCQYMDSYTMYQKLAAIYIASEKYDKADTLFTTQCKKYGSKQPNSWISYASFLLDRNNNEEAHKILAKALQVLPKREHVDIVRKFAQLEFQKGDLEQGRSLFEGLLSDVPKRIDLWNVYIDQEIKAGDNKKVDDLFERVVERKLTKKQAKFFFAKWLTYEEQHGDEKSQDYVKAKAAEYAQTLIKK